MRLSDLYRAVKTGYAPDLRTLGYARVLRNAAVAAVKTVSGALPLSFTAKGMPLLGYTLYGDTMQDGTPAPDAPVEVRAVGDYDAGTGLYKIPISVQSEDGTESTTTIYLDKPLHKVDDYSDSVDYSEGVVKRQIKELVLTGNEQWMMYAEKSVHQFYAAVAFKGIAATSAYSNIVRYGVTANNRGSYEFGCYTVTSGTQIAFQMRGAKDRFTSITAWKSYLAEQYNNGTPVKVYYVLEAPETENITLPQIPTYNGMTTLDASTAVKPSSMEIKYR